MSYRLEKYFSKNKIQIEHRINVKETIEAHKMLDFSNYNKLTD